MDFFVKFLYFLLQGAASLYLIFCLFRIPPNNNKGLIATCAILISFVHFLFRWEWDNQWSPTAECLTLVLILTVRKKYPFLYSFVIGGIHLLIVMTLRSWSVETTHLLSFPGNSFYQNMPWVYAAQNTAIVLACVLLTGVLSHYRLGFSFRSSDYQPPSIYNYYACLLLAAVTSGLVLIQTGWALTCVFPRQLFFISGTPFLLAASLVFAHQFNRAVLRERYDK